MPIQRNVYSVEGPHGDHSLTLWRDDQSVEGSWSHPDVPLLVFADNRLPGSSATFHGGAIGTGLPVQLLFWGAWWLSPAGSSRRAMIEERAQAMLASEYFSELHQYGVDRPRWRGATIVTKPIPPISFNSTNDEQVVPNLLAALIEDNVFPDADDERIAFIVLMPAGFTQTINVNGAHTYHYNLEPSLFSDFVFPFDLDQYWVGWVRSFGDDPGEDPEDVIRTMSHELVELFTDPELDGWYVGSSAAAGELGDVAVSGNVKQTAWVNGAHVQAYWSNRHSATVIPIDRDYRARISGAMITEGVEMIDRGSFRPDVMDQKFCELVPACCLPDRDFSFEIDGRNEVARLHIETQRYRQPTCSWAIEGTPVSGTGDISLTVTAQRFSGRRSITEMSNVRIAFTTTETSIELRAVGEKKNFDITVGCSVTDASITGNVLINVIARPSVRIGFSGVELTLDPEYVQARKECNKAVSDMFGQAGHGGISRRPKPGEAVILDPNLLAELPAYSRVTQYRAAREVVQMARLAGAIMPSKLAKAYAKSLATDVPALANIIETRRAL